MRQQSQFILASGSARRRELLDQMGLTYEVVKTDVDECIYEGEAATDYVYRIATKKARAIAAGGCSQQSHGWPRAGRSLLSRLFAPRVSRHSAASWPDPDGANGTSMCVLAADTAVVLGGKILGKPGSVACATGMLLRLSGRTHEVFSAVVLITGGGKESRRLSVSRVTFDVLDPDWITAYCASGEPLDKAGAYAIQGFAAQWITRLEGSYSGVMGLPLYETMDLLRAAGIQARPRG